MAFGQIVFESDQAGNIKMTEHPNQYKGSMAYNRNISSADKNETFRLN